MENKKSFKIRDKRKRGWFWLDNEYFNGYAKVFGPIGTAIYLSLCRHADENEQKCFPSENTIANELNITDRTVRKYLKLFEKYHFIKIEKERSSQGKWLNNTYWLLDKDEWSNPEEIISDGIHRKLNAKPSETERKTIGNGVPLNNTHKKETHKNNTISVSKETPSKDNSFSKGDDASTSPKSPPSPNLTEFSGQDINELIALFEPINPSYKSLFKNKTQRKALEEIVKEKGLEPTRKLLEVLPRIVIQKYAPVISTPCQLRDKMGDLMIFLQRSKKKIGYVDLANPDTYENYKNI